jgi:hypothetical protein
LPSHRRIRVRTDVVRRLLEPDPAREEMMEVVLEPLGEIRGATETLETLLQDGRFGPEPAAWRIDICHAHSARGDGRRCGHVTVNYYRLSRSRSV